MPLVPGESITLVYSTYEEDTRDPVMVIRGQVDAVMAIAEAMKSADMVKSYRRYEIDQVRIVFKMIVDAGNSMTVFRYIHDEAWKHLDTRGQAE